jgi:hypothetical protein
MRPYPRVWNKNLKKSEKAYKRPYWVAIERLRDKNDGEIKDIKTFPQNSSLPEKRLKYTV